MWELHLLLEISWHSLMMMPLLRRTGYLIWPGAIRTSGYWGSVATCYLSGRTNVPSGFLRSSTGSSDAAIVDFHLRSARYAISSAAICRFAARFSRLWDAFKMIWAVLQPILEDVKKPICVYVLPIIGLMAFCCMNQRRWCGRWFLPAARICVTSC